MTRRKPAAREAGNAAESGRNSRAPRYLVLAGAFVLVFVAAFALAWFILRPDAAAPPAAAQGGTPVRAFDQGEFDAFMAAVAEGDFDAMRRIGNALFREGMAIPGGRELLAEYETTSYSPTHLVYILHHHIGADRTHRVLLTMDDNDRVISFMAEDMAIAK